MYQKKVRILAQRAFAQALFSLCLVALGGLVFMSGFSLVLAVANTTDALQNVNAGTTTIDAVPSSINFSDADKGTTSSANTGSNKINITETEDGSWTLSGYFNTNFVKTDNAAVQMAINEGGTLRMRWFPAIQYVTNETGDSGGANITNGSNADFEGIASGNALTQAQNTSSETALGKFGFQNLQFNYNVPITALTGSYSAAFVISLI